MAGVWEDADLRLGCIDELLSDYEGTMISSSYSRILEVMFIPSPIHLIPTQDLQAQALLDYEEQLALDAQEFQAQTRVRTPLDNTPQEEVTSEAPQPVETTTQAEVTTTAPEETTTTESTNEYEYEYEYDSGDASERTLTLARNKREASILLYPTTLQTKFVPAYFSDDPDQQVGKSRTKRQVCTTPHTNFRHHSKNIIGIFSRY